MRSHPSLLIGLAALTLVVAVPARAQYVELFDEVIPPRAIVWRLNDRGFTEISRPRFDGRAYVVEAESPNGGRIRLFVDARDGALLGRVRLEPSLPPARIGRPGTAYGWTEEDAGIRRQDIGRQDIGRQEADRLIPPGDIPSGPNLARRPPLRGTEADRVRPERMETARRADPNVPGLNPDAVRRSPEPSRKTVRLAPPAKATDPKSADPKPRESGPEAARTAPTAPLPILRPADSEAPAAKPEPPVAAIEAPKAAPPTPAAVQPPPPEAAAQAADAKPPAQSWKDPPAENKRTVRIIDGATVVPGAGDRASGNPE